MIQSWPVLSYVVDLKQSAHALQVSITYEEEKKLWLRTSIKIMWAKEKIKWARL